MAPREIFKGFTQNSYFLKIVPPLSDEELVALDKQQMGKTENPALVEWAWSDLAMNSRGMQIMGFDADRFGHSADAFDKHAEGLRKQIGGGAILHSVWYETKIGEVIPEFVLSKVPA